MASMARRSGTRGLWPPSRCGSRGGSKGFDPLPQGIGDAPLIIADGDRTGFRGGLGLGHGSISWGDNKHQEILRNGYWDRFLATWNRSVTARLWGNLRAHAAG